MTSDELGKVELLCIGTTPVLRLVICRGSVELLPEESDERSSFKDVVLENRLTTCHSSGSILG